MPFKFSVQSKNIVEVIQKAKKHALNSGFDFTGDFAAGKFYGQKMGFELGGNYIVSGENIQIEITKKPFVLGEKQIKAEVEKFFA